MFKGPEASGFLLLYSSFWYLFWETEEDEGKQKKRLEALLAYHQSLVVKKGLPPSRLMMQHAVGPPALPVQAEQGDPIRFQWHLCEFTTYSQQGVKVHIEKQYSEQQEPKVDSEGKAPRKEAPNSMS